jgi:predicted transposase YdaD
LKGLEEGKLKGMEEGKLKGLEEGRLKGLEEVKIQIETTVVNLFKRGTSISVIAEILQIEADEVERIITRTGLF